MAKLNKDIATITNEAFKQAIGNKAVGEINLTDVIDSGKGYVLVNAGEDDEEKIPLETIRDQFFNALLSVCVDNWYLETSYAEQYRDVFFEDARQFGAISQLIEVDIPEAKENSAWQTFNDGDTVGTYNVYLPTVNARLFGKTVSFELPLTLSGEQLDDAFTSGDKLLDFTAFVQLNVNNQLTARLEEMNSTNRNNFIAEKIAYAGTDGAKGIHKINLVELYQSECGSTIETVEDFLKDGDAMRWASGKIKLFIDYMSKMTELFNTEGKKRFTPKERVVVQVLSYFDKAMDTFALSTTYHDDIVALPNFEAIPCWQGFGTDLSFDSVSKIDVVTGDGNDVAQGGVVCFVADKWAIRHTIRKRRVAHVYHEIEDLHNYRYQFREQYCNCLSMNGIVFTVEDNELT